jgi:Mg2+ and Co2+ transporter CorA
MNKTVNVKTLNDLNSIPPILYKYRSWDDHYDKTILTEQHIFFAAPTSFEDPLDCKNKVRYDLLTDEEIFQKYLSDSQSKNPNFSKDEHRKWAKKHFEKSPLRNSAILDQMQKKKFEEYDKRMGVLSLTADPRNIRMWEKYSNNHKGFCVGFNTKSLFRSLGGGGMVDYVKELPEIHPFHSYEEQHYLQVFKKLAKWDFEKEYRTHIFSSSPKSKVDRIVKVPANSYNCLIIGAQMHKNQKEDLIKSMTKELDHIEVLEAVIDDGKVCID